MEKKNQNSKMNPINLQEVRSVVWPKWNDVEDFLAFCRACIGITIRLSKAPHQARITDMGLSEPLQTSRLTMHDVAIQIEDPNGRQSEMKLSGVICADRNFALGVSNKWIRVRNMEFLYADSHFIDHIRGILDTEQEKLSVLWACQAHQPICENPLGRFYFHDLCDFNHLMRTIFNLSGKMLDYKK